VLDEESALAQDAQEERRARAVLDDAITSGSVRVLEEAFARAKSAGVESAKLGKAETVLKGLRAAEMRTQMQSSKWERRKSFCNEVQASGTASVPTFSTKQCSGADCKIPEKISPTAQAALAGMMEAFAIVSEDANDEPEKSAWAKKAMKRARRDSVGDLRRGCKSPMNM
jgi:hypothetical protein